MRPKVYLLPTLILTAKKLSKSLQHTRYATYDTPTSFGAKNRQEKKIYIVFSSIILLPVTNF
jgi:hypothetical protein